MTDRYDNRDRWSNAIDGDDRFDERRYRASGRERWRPDDEDLRYRRDQLGWGRDRQGASGSGDDWNSRRYGHDNRDFGQYGQNHHDFGREGDAYQGNPYVERWSSGSQQGRSGSYGEQYGLGFGAGDRAGGYGDQFGGLRYGGPYAGSEQAGTHYGRGPKNYRRSDERIREDVSEELTYHGGVDASDVEVRVENGEVYLTGTVSSRAEKRQAEDIAERVRGVRDVHNQLRVQGGGVISRVADALGFGQNDQNDDR